MKHTLLLLLTVTLCHAQLSDPTFVASLTQLTGGGASSTLNDGLVAYWKLDETSGTRVDSGSNGQDLTDNNTVTSNTGIINNAGQFVAANSEYLSHVDSATLDTGDIDFTFAAWVYLDSLGARQSILSKYDTAGNSREYWLSYESAGTKFGLTVSATGSSTVTSVFSGIVTTNTWYLVVGYHDATANVIGISVNAVAPTTAAHTTGVFAGSALFSVGSRSQGSADFFNGRIDEVGFWKKVLTADERTELYNVGAGKTCCPFAAP